MEKIYLNFKENEQPKTINDVLRKLYSGGKNRPISIETYKDKECTIIQCDLGKRRSFDAVCSIVKTYIPITNDIEIFKEFLRLPLYRNNNKFIPLLWNCFLIRKNVLDYFPNPKLYSLNIYNKIKRLNKMDSKYSWGELLKLADLNTFAKFSKYIKGEIK